MTTILETGSTFRQFIYFQVAILKNLILRKLPFYLRKQKKKLCMSYNFVFVATISPPAGGVVGAQRGRSVPLVSPRKGSQRQG